MRRLAANSLPRLTGRNAQADSEKAADGFNELGHGDRLRQIGLATGFPDALLVALKAVTATTGIALSSASSLSHLVTSSPETSGSMMSIRIKSGRCLRARSSASMPLRVPMGW